MVLGAGAGEMAESSSVQVCEPPWYFVTCTELGRHDAAACPTTAHVATTATIAAIHGSHHHFLITKGAPIPRRDGFARTKHQGQREHGAAVLADRLGLALLCAGSSTLRALSTRLSSSFEIMRDLARCASHS